MKITKKILAGLTAAVLCVTAPAGVCMAAEVHNSMTATIKPSGDSVGNYVVTENIEESESFKVLKEEAPEVVTLVETINKIVNDIIGEDMEEDIPQEGLTQEASKAAAVKFVEEIKKLLEETDEEGNAVLSEEAKEAAEKILKDMEEKELEFVTPFFDLDLEKDAEVEKNENGNYDVTLSLPMMTDSLENVNLLHYSTVRNMWEIIEPDEVDTEKQTLTAEFVDFSPVAVVAKINTEETEDVKEAAEEPEITATPEPEK